MSLTKRHFLYVQLKIKRFYETSVPMLDLKSVGGFKVFLETVREIFDLNILFLRLVLIGQDSDKQKKIINKDKFFNKKEKKISLAIFQNFVLHYVSICVSGRARNKQKTFVVFFNFVAI